MSRPLDVTSIAIPSKRAYRRDEFVGRRKELAEITRRVAQGKRGEGSMDLPVLNFWGIEGCGKSWLMRHLARRYRGRHRLTRRNDGSPKCVACFMCATACPDNCINIVGGEKEDQSETEKYPIVYELDIARCCFCGMCVEACPEDAIRMDTGHVEFSDYSRKSLLYDRDTLLSFEPADDVWR